MLMLCHILPLPFCRSSSADSGTERWWPSTWSMVIISAPYIWRRRPSYTFCDKLSLFFPLGWVTLSHLLTFIYQLSSKLFPTCPMRWRKGEEWRQLKLEHQENAKCRTTPYWIELNYQASLNWIELNGQASLNWIELSSFIELNWIIKLNWIEDKTSRQCKTLHHTLSRPQEA